MTSFKNAFSNQQDKASSERSWQCVSSDHRQLKSAEREEFFDSALVRPRPVILNHGKAELRCWAREKDEIYANVVEILSEIKFFGAVKSDSEVFYCLFPQTLVKASEKNLKNTESYRSEAKRLNDFPIFFSPSVYGLAMINASLNRIRNEDILHLQRARKRGNRGARSQRLSKDRISVRQLESNQLRPVPVTRHGSLYGEGS